jgi:hypothetical protein
MPFSTMVPLSTGIPLDFGAAWRRSLVPRRGLASHWPTDAAPLSLVPITTGGGASIHPKTRAVGSGKEDQLLVTRKLLQLLKQLLQLLLL